MNIAPLSSAQVNAIFGAGCYPHHCFKPYKQWRRGISHWNDLVFLVWEASRVQQARVNLAELSLEQYSVGSISLYTMIITMIIVKLTL